MGGTIIKTFRLPKSLTIAWSQMLLETCSQAVAHDGPVTFDFENVQWVEPFGLTVISIALSKCLHQGKDVFYSPPVNKAANDFLEQIGFRRYFLRENASRSASTSVELKHLLSPDHGYGLAIVKLIANNIDLCRDSQLEMYTQINELMTNVFDHSKSPVGCFICAQFYPKTKLVRFTFADGGIGILNSLKKSRKFPAVKTDVNAIRLAVQPGITTRTTQCGGLGLDFVKKYTRNNKGTLSIISGRGKVNFYMNKIEDKFEDIKFDGTIVDIKISTDVPLNTREDSGNDLF